MMSEIADRRRARTAAERQREYRQRMRARGYVEILLACHADNVERVRGYAERLRRQREKTPI